MSDITKISNEELDALEAELSDTSDITKISDEELRAQEKAILQAQPRHFAPPSPDLVPAKDVDKYLESEGFTIKQPLNIAGPKEINRELLIQGAGAVEGATLGMNHALYGHARAAYDIALDGKTFTEYNALKNHYADISREQFENLRAESPISYAIGSFAGGAVTGHGIYSGVGKAAKALKYAGADKLATSWKAGAAIGAGMATTEAYFTRDNPSQYELGKAALIGGLFGGLPAYMLSKAPLVKRVGEQMGLQQAFGGFRKRTHTLMREWATKNKSTPEEAASIILDTTLNDGTRLVNPGQDVSETFVKLGKARKEAGEQISTVLKEDIEKIFSPAETMIDGQQVMDVVEQLKLEALSKTARHTTTINLNEGKTVMTPKGPRPAPRLDAPIDGDFLKAEPLARLNFQNRSYTLSEFNKKISTYKEPLRYDLPGEQIYEKKLAKAMRGILDDKMRSLIGDEGMSAYSQARKRYGLYEEVLDEVANNLDAKRSPIALVKDSVLALAVSLATSSTVMGAAAVAARLVGNSNAVQGNAGASLRRIGDAFTRNPEKWGKSIIGIGAAAHGTYTEFQNEVAYVDSTISLFGNPVQRNSQDLLDKKDKLLNIMYKFDSNTANALTEALDNFDYGAAGLILEHVSKDPRYGFVIEEGIGFDGKLSDPEDKAQIVEEMTRGASSRMLTTAQKLEGFKALKQGKIPQLAPDNKPQIPPALQNIINRIPPKPEGSVE